MADEKSEKYTEQWKTLVEQRSLWVPTWMDIRDYVLPQTGMFTDSGDRPDQMEERYSLILDGTATRASRILAAGMQGGLTSPSRPWFRLGLQDEELENNREIKIWLEDVEQRMYSKFAKTNFYNAIHTVYQEESVYGQAPLIMERDALDTIRFQTLTCGEYCIAESERGIVDTLYRELWMQARQIDQKFGYDRLPEQARNLIKKDKPFEWHKVLHVIQPRKNFDPRKKDATNMPFESVYILVGGNSPILFESGYKANPLAVPRWIVSGQSPYGFAPGHDILGDVKMLQQMAADMYEGLEKVVRPPLKAAGSLKQKISHLAGMVTYSSDTATSDSIKPIYEVKLQLGDLGMAIQDVRAQIRAGLYNDLFLMLQQPVPGMTATEVAERHEEKLLMLGPVIERQFYELLNPAVDRTFDIMYEAGELPPPPKSLVDAVAAGRTNGDLRVDYVSLLAQAQKLVATQSIRAVTGYVTSVAQFVPEILDKFDADKAVDEFAEATGAPPEIVRSDDTVAKIRAIRAKAAQQRAMQEQMAAGMQAAKTMGDTSTEEGTALGDLKQSITG